MPALMESHPHPMAQPPVASRRQAVVWRMALIFVVALAARLAAVFWLGMTDLVQGSESGAIAANLVAGHGYTFDFYGYRPNAPLQSYVPPLYTLLLAGCLRWTPAPEMALGILQAFMGSLTAVFVGLTGMEIASRRVGWLAALATALYPPFIIQTARPFSMTLNGALLAALVWLVLSLSRRPDLLRAGLAGLTAGLLTLSRSSFLGLIVVFMAWLWLNRQRMPTWGRLSAVILVAASLILLPWIARNYAVHGRLLLSTNGGHTFWNGNNPFTTGSSLDVYLDKVNAYTGSSIDPNVDVDGIIELRPYPLPRDVIPQVARLSEVELDRALYAAGLDFIRNHPGEWLRLLLTKIKSFWWFRPNLGRSSPLPGEQSPYYDPRWIAPYRAVYVIVLGLCLVGLVLSLRAWRTLALFYLLFGYLTAVYAAYNVITRYRWEIEPFLLMFGILGLASLAQEVGE